MTRLVLASASPRRREILALLGLEFETVVSAVEELTEGEPEAVVVENARRKARAGCGLIETAPGTLVIGVDTDVAIDGRLLGKAKDEATARERLLSLRGRSHEVFSGLVVCETGEGAEPRSERAVSGRTEVTFKAFDEATLELYLASAEWRDRAGAYAIQGLGSVLIESIAGDFSNVVGLPVAALLEAIPSLTKEIAGRGHSPPSSLNHPGIPGHPA